EGAVTEGDRPVRVEAGAIDSDGAAAASAAVGAFPADPAGGLVVGERALAEEEAGEYQGAGGGPEPDRAAVGSAAVGTFATGAARGLVAGEGTGNDADRGRAFPPEGGKNGAACAGAADPPGSAGPARGPVGGEGALAQEE